MCNAEILSALVLAETHSYDNNNYVLGLMC